MKLSAWWFNRRSGWCSKRSGFSINILIRIGCHTWDYHVGATINTCFTWCWTIFLKTFFIIKKGGKALRYWLDQICCIASVPWLYGFGVPWKLCWQWRSKKIHLWFSFDLTNSLTYLWKEFPLWMVFSDFWLSIYLHLHGPWKIFYSNFDPMV